MKKILLASIVSVLALAAACDDVADISTVASTKDAGVEASTLAELGKQYVAKRGCPDCHQSSDPKDGILTGQSSPRPATREFPKNLTPDPDTGIDSWTDQQYLDAIRTGIDDEGEALCGTMPKFSDMSDDEGKAIAAYLRSLVPVWRPIPESACPPIKPKPEEEDDAGDASAE